MKFADIAKRAKATKIACVLTDENGVQWVNVGAAVYRLEGLPKMSSEDFLRLAGGIRGKNRELLCRRE